MKYRRIYALMNMYKRNGAGSLVRSKQKMGRNERCHCKSGKKFKNCHGHVRIITMHPGPLRGYGFFVSMLVLFFIGLALIYTYMVK